MAVEGSLWPLGLDGDRAVLVGVEGALHHSHAALAELPFHPVMECGS
jgi:hypothetical protein